ncbi:MAG: EAL domain-containing protein [Xylophilus ampelinus]
MSRACTTALHKLKRSPEHQIGLLLAVLLLMLWIGIGHEIHSGSRQLRKENLQETRSLLRIYAEEVRSSIRAIDLTLLNLRDHLDDGGLQRFTRQVQHRLEYLDKSVAFQVAVIDAHGRLAFSSSSDAAAGVDLSDREHFQVHRQAGTRDALFISRPVLGRVSGRWSIQFTRRLSDADNHFNGVIVLSVSPEYFTRFSHVLDLGPDGALVVARDTGALLARSPTPAQGLDLALPDVPRMLSAMADAVPESDHMERPSRIDGVQRQFVLRPIAEYRLAVGMGQSSQALRDAYLHERDTYLAGGAAVSALMVLVCHILLTSLRQRSQARASLEESEFRWKYALEGAGGGVWDWDLTTGTAYFSTRWKAMLGYAPDEIAPHVDEWRRLLHPEDAPAVNAALEDYLADRAQEYAVEFRMQGRDGNWRWIRACGIAVRRDAQARPQRLIGTHEDITERRQSEEAMQLALLVYEHSGEGMLVMQADGTILTINQAFSRLTGYAAGEVVGRTTDFLLRHDPQDHPQERIWEAVRASGHWQGEVWCRRKDGGVYAEWLSINTIFDKDGQAHRRVALFSDLARKKEYEQIIWQQAHCDPLTGLLNRRIFQERLEQDIRKATHAGRTNALMFLDLDHFKEINDTLGHSAGDALLQEAARRLRGCMGDRDSVARLGGDEFAILVALQGRDDRVTSMAEAVLQQMGRPFALGLETAYVSASIGITYYPRDGDTHEVLLRNADQAMYVAKKLGRNRYQEFTPSMHEAAQLRMRLATDLRSAPAAGQLHVLYQPIVELATGRVRKAEALVRWQHPSRGLVSPQEFIPIAEQTGIIHAVGEWVFRQVAPQLARLRARHDPQFQVSLNKSPVQFADEHDAHGEWLRRMHALGLPGEALALEITESLLLEADNDRGVTAKLERLRDAGVQISLDDFGTGYSSLNYLKKFPIDTIKIDQSFVRNLTEASSDLALCRAIVAMAHALGLQVVAEGIETQAQCDLLADMGCDYGQGYWFARPLSFDDLEAFFGAGRRLP